MSHAPIIPAAPVFSHPDPFGLLVEAVRECGIFLLDPAGRIASWNAGAERITGYPAAEAIGRPCAFLCGQEAGGGCGPCDLRPAQGDGRFEGERPLARKGGARFLAALGVTALHAAGAHVGYAVTLRDVGEQRRAEEELRRTAALLRAVAEGTPDAVFVKDTSGRYLLCNEAGSRLISRSVAEILGRDDTALFEPESARAVMEWDRRVMAAGTAETLEHELTADGVARVWVATKAPYHDEHGNVVGVIGVARDVTERKRAEDAVRDSERKLNQAQRIAHVGYWDRDLDADRITWSDEVYRIFGLPPQESALNIAQFLELIHPDDQPHMAEALAGALRGGRRFDVEYRAIRPDGEVRVVHSLGDVMWDASGRPRRMFGIVQDVTERKRADDALRDSEAFLRLSQEASGVGSWEWDLTTGRVRWSENMGRIHGLAAHEFDGRLETAASFFHPDDAPGLHANMGRLMEQGVFTPTEYRIRLRNGVERTVRATGEVILDRSGKVARCIGTVSDVTERLKLEEQLRQSQKMEAIGLLAGGVAHDFNNLLTVINGFSELLLADLPASDLRREPATAIRDAGERAARLTGQLLAFSRKAVVAPKVLDLNEVIDSAGKMLRRLIGEDVTLTTVLSPGLSRVRIDPGQVEQVLMNLAVNARDAMPRGGRLTIETKDVAVGEGDVPGRADPKPGRQVRLSVADTGDGMTDEVKARIFEPFFTTKGVGKGTGLGLATVYGIVKQAGGDIAVDSRVGAGTRFTILLPALPETGEPAESGALRVAPRGAETVLLAEDEDAVRKLARLALEMQGYTVVEAGTGADAVRVAETYPGPVHLLATDVVMPDLGGRDLAEAVRARRPGVKVLYMSGYTDDAVIRHGVSEVADAFLQKPFTPLGLARKVREVLDGPS